MIAAREEPTGCPGCGNARLEQDPDVLDTWFSSGLWPFSTLGWPDETPDLKYFYPTSMLETGYDILFFWVARMIMDGLEFTGQVPFHTVYLHGLIRDESGRKMSKSYGNVIDPLGVMDELGTDALRFTLLVGSTPGNDMNLSVKKVEANRNFANKIWNVARFVLTAVESQKEVQSPNGKASTPDVAGSASSQSWTLADRWIRARLAGLTRDVERLFQNYQYGEAGRQIYDFFWSEFADWYVEIAKLQLDERHEGRRATAENLVFVLDTCLRLLHPFTPFVTEELWGFLKRAAQGLFAPAPGGEWEPALILARWPAAAEAADWEAPAVTEFSLVMEIIRSIRNLRAEKAVQPGRRIPALISAGSAASRLRAQSATLAALAHLDENALQISESLPEKPQGSIALVVGHVEIYLPLAGLVDLEEEQKRLNKELSDIDVQVQRLEKLLSSSFTEKAPAAVVQKERDKLAIFRETAAKLRGQIETLK